jgi:hypothetical protein
VPREDSAPPVDFGHRWFAAALTLSSGFAIAAALQSHWPMDHLALVVFTLFAPAAATSSASAGGTLVSRRYIAAAGACAINAMVVQVMLAADAWSRPGGVVAVGAVSACLWLVPSGSARTTVTTDPVGDLHPDHTGGAK